VSFQTVAPRELHLECDPTPLSSRLPFGPPHYGGAISNAIGYAIHSNRSHDAVIRVYDAAGNVIETHEHTGHVKKYYLLAVRIAVANTFPPFMEWPCRTYLQMMSNIANRR
jgi:hypothetical protein